MAAVFPSPVSAVLFDMDGLLFDTERIYLEATFDAARKQGREIAREFCTSMIGVPRAECTPLIQAHVGPDFSMQAFWQAYDARKWALMQEGVPLKAGAVELLEFLRQRGVPCGMATSSAQVTADRYLDTSGMRSHFSILVTREDVTHTKPHPEPYLMAAERLATPPSQCLVLEDSPLGVRAAHAAGAMPVMVPDLLPATGEISALCVAVVPDLHAVRTMLAAR